MTTQPTLGFLGGMARYREPDGDTLAWMAGIFPPFFMDIVRNDGFSTYCDRALWLVDPREFSQIVDAWEETVDAWEETSPRRHMFARNAWGVFYSWDGERILRNDIHTGSCATMVSEFEGFVRMLDRSRSGLVESEETKHARELVGRLDIDEIYGYDPPLALWGDGSIDTVRRYKFVEHALYLATLDS